MRRAGVNETNETELRNAGQSAEDAGIDEAANARRQRNVEFRRDPNEGRASVEPDDFGDEEEAADVEIGHFGQFAGDGRTVAKPAFGKNGRVLTANVAARRLDFG